MLLSLALSSALAGAASAGPAVRWLSPDAYVLEEPSSFKERVFSPRGREGAWEKPHDRSR